MDRIWSKALRLVETFSLTESALLIEVATKIGFMVMSLMASFCVVPRDVLGEILILIESVFEGFPTYFYFIVNIVHKQEICCSHGPIFITYVPRHEYTDLWNVRPAETNRVDCLIKFKK